MTPDDCLERLCNMKKSSAKGSVICRGSFGGIEVVEARFSDHQFSPHRHDIYVIGITTTGVQRFQYRGEECFCLPGEAFILHPDELHDGRAGSDMGYSYRALNISPELISAALNGPPLPFVKNPVSRSRRLIRAIKELSEISSRPTGELGEMTALGELAYTLSELQGKQTSRVTNNYSDLITTIRDYLDERLLEDVRVAELEAEFAIDRFTLNRQFRQYFGVSCYRYIVQRRLDRAKHLIQSNLPLAESAISSGFADQSHMTRHFRATYGLTPGEWRGLQQSDPIRHSIAATLKESRI